MSTPLKCENVRLPMACCCDEQRKADLDENRLKAQEALSTDHRPVNDRNFTTAAIGYLWGWHSAEVSTACDQWFGVYATVEKMVECLHTKEECPDEPECFVYRFDPVLKVSVECDRVEDGLATLVLWFKENRKDEDDE
jgi:hypothetical protein